MATPANLYGSVFPEMLTEDPYAIKAGSGLDQASQPVEATTPATTGYKDMGKGAVQSMNAGGTAGSTLTGAGIMGIMGGAAPVAGPVALGAGLALSAYEQAQKAEAMNEQARVQEAQQRKADVQTALNQALGATRQLGV